VGDEYFRTLAKGIAEFVAADYVLVGELLPGEPARIGVIGAVSPQGPCNMSPYVLAGTPSEQLIALGTYACQSGLPEQYPDDHNLREQALQACTGVALADGSGNVIGLIQVLWHEPRPETDDAAIYIKIFAARAAVELERTLGQRKLDTYAHQLEGMVSARTQELTTAIATLQRAQGDLIEAEKLASLGRLVAGIAHELNTPIGNSVTVSTTMIERVRSLDTLINSGALKRSALTAFIDDVREGAQLLATSLRHAAELIHDFKQVAVDQTSSQRRRFHLRTVVDEIVTTLQPRMKKTHHVINVDIDEAIELDSYPGPLGQVIMNLLNNALDHAFEHCADGWISIEAATNGGSAVALVVSDTGCGMSEDIRAKIFDPFFTTKLGRGGSGLGMNIVYNIITGILGGRISVDSVPGKGSRFMITIPLLAPKPQGKIEA
jgi:signal transduction histidine kinase